MTTEEFGIPGDNIVEGFARAGKTGLTFAAAGQLLARSLRHIPGPPHARPDAQLKWLRERGYEVTVDHNRLVDFSSGKAVILAKGGETQVTMVHAADRSRIHVFIARCSREDNFNRRRGATIALGRAVKWVRQQAYLQLTSEQDMEIRTQRALALAQQVSEYQNPLTGRIEVG